MPVRSKLPSISDSRHNPRMRSDDIQACCHYDVDAIMSLKYLSSMPSTPMICIRGRAVRSVCTNTRSCSPVTLDQVPRAHCAAIQQLLLHHIRWPCRQQAQSYHSLRGWHHAQYVCCGACSIHALLTSYSFDGGVLVSEFVSVEEFERQQRLFRAMRAMKTFRLVCHFSLT